MEKRYALINNNIVENVIVIEDLSFIDHIKDKFDIIELLDTEIEQKRASIGWIFDSNTKTFSEPVTEESIGT